MDRTRPAGLMIVSALGIVWGLLAVSLQFIVGGGFGLFADLGKATGFPGPFLAASALLIALLWVLTGLGLILGVKWGWWLASWHYMSGVFRFGQAFVLSTQYPGQTARNLLALAIRDAVCILVYASLLVLIYSRRVREWCHIDGIPPSRAALFSAGTVLVMLASVSLVLHFFFRSAG